MSKESHVIVEESFDSDKLEYYGVFDPCAGCLREDCVGCKYSCPDEYDAYQNMLNCLADGRSDF